MKVIASFTRVISFTDVEERESFLALPLAQMERARDLNDIVCWIEERLLEAQIRSLARVLRQLARVSPWTMERWSEPQLRRLYMLWLEKNRDWRVLVDQRRCPISPR